MADKEWVYDQSYSSWFYLKSGGRYAQNNGLVPTILNLVATWPIRNGFTTQTIKLGTIFKDDGVYVTGTYAVDGKISSSKGMENGFVN